MESGRRGESQRKRGARRGGERRRERGVISELPLSVSHTLAPSVASHESHN